MFSTDNDSPEITEIVSEQDRRAYLEVAAAVATEDGNLVEEEERHLRSIAKGLDLDRSIWRKAAGRQLDAAGLEKKVGKIGDRKWAKFLISECLQTALADKDYDARERALLPRLADAAGLSLTEFWELEEKIVEPLLESKRDDESKAEFEERLTAQILGVSHGVAASIPTRDWVLQRRHFG